MLDGIRLCALRIVLLCILLTTCVADYNCVCNYHVELAVHPQDDKQSSVFGYMYEFDCKPEAPNVKLSGGWLAVMFEHKLGFVESDSNVMVQICPGNIPAIDMLPPTTTVTTQTHGRTSTTTTTTQITTRTTTTNITTPTTTTPTPTTSTITTPSTTTTTTTPQTTTTLTTSTQTTTASTTTTPSTTTQATTTPTTTTQATTTPSTTTTTTTPQTTTTPTTTTQTTTASTTTTPTTTTQATPTPTTTTQTTTTPTTTTQATTTPTATTQTTTAPTTTTQTTTTPTTTLTTPTTTTQTTTTPTTTAQTTTTPTTTTQTTTTVTTIMPPTTTTPATTIPTTTAPATSTAALATHPTVTGLSAFHIEHSALCPKKQYHMTHATPFGYCYEFVVTSPRMHDLAELYCNKSGGHLLSVTSVVEEEYLYQILTQSNLTNINFWTGLNVTSSSNNATWSDGSSANHVPFIHKDQNMPGNCFVFQATRNDSILSQGDCSIANPFICKYPWSTSASASSNSSSAILVQGTTHAPIASSISATTTSQVSLGSTDKCPKYPKDSIQSGFLIALAQHGTSCYELFHDTYYWQQAQYQCAQHGGQVLQITNSGSEEQAYVEDFLRQNGIHEEIWLSSNTAISQIHPPYQYCRILNPQQNGQWLQTYCLPSVTGPAHDVPRRVICEYDLLNTTPSPMQLAFVHAIVG